MIDDVPFLVVGVMETKAQDSSYSGRDKDKAFIPDATFKGLFSERYVSNFIFQAQHPLGWCRRVTKRVYEVLGRGSSSTRRTRKPSACGTPPRARSSSTPSS